MFNREGIRWFHFSKDYLGGNDKNSLERTKGKRCRKSHYKTRKARNEEKVGAKGSDKVQQSYKVELLSE